MMVRLLGMILFGLGIVSCQNEPAQSNQKSLPRAQSVALNDSFNQYWYNGQAEVNTYLLEQARYGDIHQGHATMIFVTEPFSQSKQVKLDRPQSAGSDKINVMKLNFVRKFNTGIYPYSTMMSSFQPISEKPESPTIKASFSAQEWCGQTYLQLNQETSYDYQYKGFSYFESEGDIEGKLKGVYLEDGLWNLLRIQPDALPLGNIKILPGAQFLRLRHQPLKGYVAQAQLKTTEGGKMEYSIVYNDINRSVRILFEKVFPHKILEWEEVVSSPSGKNIRTKARLQSSIRSAYWQKNGKSDRALREELKLPVDCQ